MGPFKDITYRVNSWAQRNNFPPRLVWLVGINVAVFLLYNIVDKSLLLFGIPSNTLFTLLAMPTDLIRLLAAPWTLVTSIFFHEGVWHILFNMVWLWFFGRLFLRYFSSADLLRVYLLGGVAGNLLCMLSYAAFPYFQNAAPISYILGASGAAMAITLAITMKIPREKVYLWATLAIEVRYVAIFVVGIDILSITGDNAGGHIAHIGGALFGMLYGPAQRYLQGLRSDRASRRRARPSGKPSPKRGGGRTSQRRTRNEQTAHASHRPTQTEDEKLAAILNKLSQGGYGALSSEEKEYLFNHNR